MTTTADDLSIDTEVIQTLLEPLLSALRRRDGEKLEQLKEESSRAARVARAAFAEKRQPDHGSYLLGALEAIKSFSTKAAHRHSANARFEVASKPRARRLLRQIAHSAENEATPSVLAERLGVHLPNVSTLLGRLREHDLVEKVQRDGRSAEYRLTPSGREVLEELEPEWAQVELPNMHEPVPRPDPHQVLLTKLLETVEQLRRNGERQAIELQQLTDRTDQNLRYVGEKLADLDTGRRSRDVHQQLQIISDRITTLAGATWEQHSNSPQWINTGVGSVLEKVQLHEPVSEPVSIGPMQRFASAFPAKGGSRAGR